MAPWFRLCFFLFFRQEQKELLLAVTFHNIDSLMMVRYLCTYFILGLLFFGILSKIGALLVRKMFWEFRRHRIFGHVNDLVSISVSRIFKYVVILEYLTMYILISDDFMTTWLTS